MANKAKRKKTKSIRWGAFVVVFLILFGGINFGQKYLDYLDMKDEVSYYQDKLDAVKDSYAQLQNEKNLVFNDSYIERLARENLGMIKKGETLILPMVKSNVPEADNNIDSEEMIH